jgi:hypothetical protein
MLGGGCAAEESNAILCTKSKRFDIKVHYFLEGAELNKKNNSLTN